ncbi:restriction endonuclease subunit S [Maribacter polysiphoniae]|uniref:Restriction endonuclease subunit S n=1 Tax=Maribacter polysiphoniae TaxID=429344 RepID=A0A316DWI3_9FLAO|nr:restriction endonuclease subunit S [Maribacter polysiphoniae]MBD1261996.1 restriction endonuclease subunit S [Maribacter polysiphoniae]PWK21682.1 type I restriction enzyme S subunit [Maribacter polysiphoniae]
MRENWKTYKLSEITSKIGSGATPRGGKGAYKDSGISLIRSQNVLDFTFSTNGLAFIDEKQAAKLKNVEVESKDVLLNITGDSVARVCQIPDQFFPARVNQHVAIIRADNKILDPDFLKYSLLTYQNKNELLNLSSAGATRKAITKSMIEDFEIKIPEITEQRAIASILSAIDDKIENNLAMNKTLEDMAMALYKHWFVDFGPFKDGKFIDSELGKIPEGWEVIKLEDLVEIKYGKDHKKLNDGSIPVFGSGGIMRYVDTHLYDKESVLVPRKGSLNNIFLVSQPFWSVDTMFYTKMKHDNSLKYVYHLLKGMKLGDMDVGSAIPSLTTKLLNSLEVILPSSQVLSKYEENTTRLYEQIWANENENKTLTQLRDTLLPKLISGEVRLKEFEEKITAVL